MGSNRVEARQAVATNLKVDASGVAVPVTDNGGSLTVDGTVAVSGTSTISGTVTANAGTNLNTSALALEAGNLAGILTAVQVIDNIVSGSEAQVDIVAALPAGTNNIGDVDVLSSALPTGASTETTLAAAAASLSVLDDWDETDRAKVNTIAGQVGVQGAAGAVTALTQRVVLATDQTVIPVGDNGGSLTVDGTVAATYATTGSGNATGALRVEVANNGTGVIATVGAVTAITNALPAGTNAIGKLAANSGVDIGDVDVTSIPGTGVEDAAETAGGTLLMAGSVRRDTPASSSGTTGDNSTINTDALGHLWVAQPAIVRISVTPTVSTSPAYTAKDAVGGLLTFANAVRVSAGNAILQSVTIIDNSQQRPSLELVLFNQTFTASTDNAIFAPSDADLANTLGVVAINSWSDFSTNSVATVDGIGKTIVLTGTSLFGQLVTRGTPTFVATTDIIVILGIIYN